MSREFPCIYFDENGKCRRFSDDTAVSYCVMGPCPERRLSYADCIRTMDDEQLANLLCSIYGSGHIDFMNQEGGEDIKAIFLKDLQSPVEEDTNG